MNTLNALGKEHFVYEQRVIPTSGIGSFADLAAYGHTWQWMTYGRDNTLRYAQRSSHDVSGHRTVFTEYRYDAR